MTKSSVTAMVPPEEAKKSNCRRVLERMRLQSSLDDLMTINLYISILAECLGTFLLVYIGSHSGSFVVNSVQVGFGFGFGAAVVIYCIGNISGGHINPAVSWGLLVAREISLAKFVLFSLAQTAGAVGAAQLARLSNIFANRSQSDQDQESDQELFVTEIIITFFLVFTVLRLCVEERNEEQKAFAPLIIGLSIMLGVYSGGVIGGGSMNPAASIGLSMKDSRLWIFIVSPLVGATIAALFHQLIFTSKMSKEHLLHYLIYSNFKNDANYGKVKENGEKGESNNNPEESRL